MIPNHFWVRKLSQPLQTNGIIDKSRPNRVIVEAMNSRSCDRIAALIDANQGKVHKEIRMIPSLVAELPFTSLEELARSRYVYKIWQDAPVHAMLDVAVPASGGTIAHQEGLTGKGVVVAVLDTGIDPHEDLIAPSNRILAWKDFINSKSFPYDDNGHGTHVAGIIAGNGRSSNGEYRGMAPDAKLVGVKVLNEDGDGTVSDVIAGIEWCIESLSALNIRAINLSIGSEAQESYRTDPLCRATTAAWQSGIVVCAAAGNSGPKPKTINTPGINPVIITVGNLDDQNTLTDIDDLLNYTSSRGPTLDNLPKPDLVAPGTKITSLKVGGGYTTLSGSSMATPLVTGGAALMIQKWPHLKPDQVKTLLMKKARDLGLGPDLQGAGSLDLEAIFKDAAKGGMLNNLNPYAVGLIKSLMEVAGSNSTHSPTAGLELLLKVMLNSLGNFK